MQQLELVEITQPIKLATCLIHGQTLTHEYLSFLINIRIFPVCLCVFFLVNGHEHIYLVIEWMKRSKNRVRALLSY